MVWVGWDAGDRADFYALAGGENADAFGASRPVDLVDFFALEDGVVGTFRLADIAVDALVGDV